MSATTEPTLEQLTELADEARRLTVERDEAILAAVNAGVSQREAARAAGLSHTAVQHIVRRANT